MTETFSLRFNEYEHIDAVELIQEALGSGSWHMEFNEKGELVSVFWSQVFRQMIGYKDINDFPNVLDVFFNLLHKDDKERVIRHYWNAVKDYTDRSLYDIEYRVLTKKRGYRWFHAAGRVARREDGSPISIVGFFIDIDDKKRAEESLRIANKAREEQLHVLQSLANMYFSMHLVNLETDSIKEYSSDELIKPFFSKGLGATETMRLIMSKVIHPSYLHDVLEFTDLSTISERLKGLNSLSSEFVGIHTGWFIANFITIEKDAEGRARVVLFTTQIIDERKRKEQMLFIKSMTDEMTGCLNRRAYEEELDYYRHHEIDDNLAFVSIDINRLKYVNDNLGHAAGDKLIRGVASVVKKIRELFDKNAKVFRIGGDEFVAIGCITPENYKCIEDCFIKMIKEWQESNRSELSLSYGVALRRDCRNYTIDEMAKIADKLMYQAKSKYYRNEGIDRRG